MKWKSLSLLIYSVLIWSDSCHWPEFSYCHFNVRTLLADCYHSRAHEHEYRLSTDAKNDFTQATAYPVQQCIWRINICGVQTNKILIRYVLDHENNGNIMSNWPIFHCERWALQTWRRERERENLLSVDNGQSSRLWVVCQILPVLDIQYNCFNVAGELSFSWANAITNNDVVIDARIRIPFLSN